MLAIRRESYLTPEKPDDPNSITLKYVKKATKKRKDKQRQLVTEEEYVNCLSDNLPFIFIHVINRCENVETESFVRFSTL